MGRAAPPARAPFAQGPWRILQHHSGAPSRNHRPWQSPRPPLMGPTPGWCHGILSRGPLPYFPTTSGSERGWARWCPRGDSVIEGQVHFWGQSWALVHPQSPGWARGRGGDTSAEGVYPNSWCLGSAAQSHACLFVLSPEVRPGSQCASRKEPASQSVPGARPPGARLPGHAAAAEAQLPETVAPPVRRPEMPLPL